MDDRGAVQTRQEGRQSLTLLLVLDHVPRDQPASQQEVDTGRVQRTKGLYLSSQRPKPCNRRLEGRTSCKGPLQNLYQDLNSTVDHLPWTVPLDLSIRSVSGRKASRMMVELAVELGNGWTNARASEGFNCEHRVSSQVYRGVTEGRKRKATYGLGVAGDPTSVQIRHQFHQRLDHLGPAVRVGSLEGAEEPGDAFERVVDFDPYAQDHLRETLSQWDSRKKGPREQAGWLTPQVPAPPPRMAQNRSAFSHKLAFLSLPSAVTSSYWTTSIRPPAQPSLVF